MMDINWHTVVIVLGLAAVTVLARGFFLFSNRTWSLPHWAQRGLQYAPIAALAAVVVPEVVMVQGHLIDTWQDARVYSAVVGAAVYFWRKDVLYTIVAGMAVYMPLHLGLGW
ncbi:MAG: AzlD domain-containing protein [Rhodoferax sp.]|jgi:branched-subunit amino acid transport protein|nr:AzlD domain-containing protein [Rhodoferax sp.]MBP9927963.1 AzlD domain-containing protein [Rhodoferax sp.]HQX57964.1 AzlD domain-containing protein [Burkholderiaceae bacterium]HQZ06208.1 AzlD domain-containing protein [Burkholderiaceae bacterium]HRA62127.1 AzlD domain-containing protein [Burkholderiaceae bacterium]